MPPGARLLIGYVQALLSSPWRERLLGIMKFVVIQSVDVHVLISLATLLEEIQRDSISVLLLLSHFSVHNMIRLHTTYGVCAVFLVQHGLDLHYSCLVLSTGSLSDGGHCTHFWVELRPLFLPLFSMQ